MKKYMILSLAWASLSVPMATMCMESDDKQEESLALGSAGQQNPAQEYSQAELEALEQEALELEGIGGGAPLTALIFNHTPPTNPLSPSYELIHDGEIIRKLPFFLKKYSAQINTPDINLFTPLMAAAIVRLPIQAVKMLLDKGADHRILSGVNETALDIARSKDPMYKDGAVIELLEQAAQR